MRCAVFVFLLLVSALIVGIVINGNAQDQIIIQGEEIPVYKGAKLVGAFDVTNNPAGRMNIRIYHVKSSVSGVATFYNNHLRSNTWKVSGQQLSPNLFHATAQKGNARCIIQVVPHGADLKNCEIRIMWP